MAKVLSILFGFLGFLTVVIFPFSTAAASSTFNLTTSPVSEVVYAKPGSSTTTTLHVLNNSATPINLRIKLFTFGAQGTSGKPALRLPTAADTFISWAHFSPSTFVAQPDVPTKVTMTLDIPKTASLGYNYGVAFEPLNQTIANNPGTTISGTNVILVLVDTTSANEVHSVKVASFTVSKHLYEYLPATFNINVHNNGNIFLAPSGDIFISKNSNFSAGSIIDTIPVNNSQGNVLPGTNRVFTAQWTDGFPVYVPKEIAGHEVVKNNQLVYSLQWNFSKANRLRFGKYYAKLILSYNNGIRQVPVVAVVSFWVVPWKLLLILLVVLVLVLIGLRRWAIQLVNLIKKLTGALSRRYGKH